MLGAIILEVIGNIMVLSNHISEYLIGAVQGIIIIVAMLAQCAASQADLESGSRPQVRGCGTGGPHTQLIARTMNNNDQFIACANLITRGLSVGLAAALLAGPVAIGPRADHGGLDPGGRPWLDGGVVYFTNREADAPSRSNSRSSSRPALGRPGRARSKT